MAVEAELRRESALGGLVPWLLNPDGTDPVADEVARTRLAEIVAALVTLLAQTDGLASEAKLEAVRALLAAPLTVNTGLSLASTEARLVEIRDFLDTVETLLTQVGANTDGLEGLTDGLEGLLTTVRDSVDGLETAVGLVAREATLAGRFGPVDNGDPRTLTGVGPHDLAVPGGGQRVRLKWISLQTRSTDPIEATLQWKPAGAARPIYVQPLDYAPLVHGVHRAGAVGEKLQLMLSTAGIPVYVNLDWEAF